MLLLFVRNAYWKLSPIEFSRWTETSGNFFHLIACPLCMIMVFRWWTSLVFIKDSAVFSIMRFHIIYVFLNYFTVGRLFIPNNSVKQISYINNMWLHIFYINPFDIFNITIITVFTTTICGGGIINITFITSLIVRFNIWSIAILFLFCLRHQVILQGVTFLAFALYYLWIRQLELVPAHRQNKLKCHWSSASIEPNGKTKPWGLSQLFDHCPLRQKVKDWLMLPHSMLHYPGFVEWSFQLFRHHHK